MKTLRKIYNYVRWDIEWEHIINVIILGFLIGLGFSLAVKIIL